MINVFSPPHMYIIKTSKTHFDASNFFEVKTLKKIDKKIKTDFF